MDKALTRRQFIKGTVGAVTCLSVMGLPVDGMAEVHCQSCGAVPRQRPGAAILPIAADLVRYCPNCGVSLQTNSHDITCADYEVCVALGVAVCGDPIAKGSPCFQVPFPNRRFLVGKNQSKDISALKF